jgi:predicted amidohydrolase YtcJ
VLLEKDLFGIPPEDIAGVGVRVTVVGGRVGFEATP